MAGHQLLLLMLYEHSDNPFDLLLISSTVT